MSLLFLSIEVDSRQALYFMTRFIWTNFTVDQDFKSKLVVTTLTFYQSRQATSLLFIEYLNILS